jgi:hypothetical protein
VFAPDHPVTLISGPRVSATPSRRLQDLPEHASSIGRVTNVPEADALLRRTYRPGWTLNG